MLEQRLSSNLTRQFVCVGRYMDDIALITGSQKKLNKHSQSIYESFKKCYLLTVRIQSARLPAKRKPDTQKV